MSIPYYGKCHKWLDDGIPGRKEGAACNCRNPDLTKDPNCHNSGHAHHDPLSPIVKMDKQVAAVEAAIDEGRAHVWQESKERDQFCTFCDMDAADLEGDAWVYCPARPKSIQAFWSSKMDRHSSSREPTAWPPPPPPPYKSNRLGEKARSSLDEGYDARHVNWPRLLERILSSTYNAIFYGSLLVLAKALGIL